MPPFKSQWQPWPGPAGDKKPRPDHGKRVIKALAGLLEEKLITAGDAGMGRAAAVAYAREGADADAAIDHFPSEDPDARKVVALIKAEGRKAIAIPGDLRMNSSVKKLV